MKILELMEDGLVSDWINTIRSEATIRSYLLGMQTFTEWIQLRLGQYWRKSTQKIGIFGITGAL